MTSTGFQSAFPLIAEKARRYLKHENPSSEQAIRSFIPLYNDLISLPKVIDAIRYAEDRAALEWYTKSEADTVATIENMFNFIIMPTLEKTMPKTDLPHSSDEFKKLSSQGYNDKLTQLAISALALSYMVTGRHLESYGLKFKDYQRLLPVDNLTVTNHYPEEEFYTDPVVFTALQAWMKERAASGVTEMELHITRGYMGKVATPAVVYWLKDSTPLEILPDYPGDTVQLQIIKKAQETKNGKVHIILQTDRQRAVTLSERIFEFEEIPDYPSKDGTDFILLVPEHHHTCLPQT